MTSNYRLILREWRPVRKNTLYGFACIELIGLSVGNVSIHQKGGRWWVSLPARPVLDLDDKHVSGPDGQKQYMALLRWRDRELANQFSTDIIALIRARYPHDLDDLFV